MEGQRLVDVEVVATIFKSLFDFSGYLKFDDVFGERVNICQEIVLVVFLYPIVRPYFHQFLYELLHFVRIFAGVSRRLYIDSRHSGLYYIYS